jgi:hypothetical protein
LVFNFPASFYSDLESLRTFGSPASNPKGGDAVKRLTISTKEFYSLVEKEVGRTFVRKGQRFHQNPCLCPPTLGPNSELRIVLPRKFRELRALLVASWFLPMDLGLLILGEIDPKKPMLNYNEEQQLEIAILSYSKNICLSYLFLSEIDSREFFGSILRSDLESAFKSLRIYWKVPSKARRKVRRKGYRDHGSRKPADRWTESFDYSFTERQNLKEKQLELFLATLSDRIRELEAEDLF